MRMPTLFANRGQGTNKEETKRVSDAENGKMYNDEALPERSDRECDEPACRDAGAQSPRDAPPRALTRKTQYPIRSSYMYCRPRRP